MVAHFTLADRKQALVQPMDFPLLIITAAVLISTGKVFAAMEVEPKIWGKADCNTMTDWTAMQCVEQKTKGPC